MITELYIEGNRLDITKDISTLLTFSLDDIQDFSSRGTTWSKTIVLPGTSNNNKLFGHIFQVGQANPYFTSLPNVGLNFNASKSAGCLIFQDQIQTFSGVLRLLQINITKGRIEYEVSVFGKLAGLNVALSGALIEQLDFSAYDHTYNDTSIVASWDNTPGSGIYYPLIDYGTYGRATGMGLTTGKSSWDIRTFRPAIYVREVIDKMITGAGFRWQSDIMDTARFKGLIVPNNQKKLYRLATEFVNGSGGEPYNSIAPFGEFLLQQTSDPSFNIDANVVKWNTIAIASNFTNYIGQSYAFQYNQPGSINVRIRWRFKGGYSKNDPSPNDFIVGVRKNGTTTYSPADFVDYRIDPGVVGGISSFDFVGDFFLLVSENDIIDLFGEYTISPPGGDSLVVLDEAYLIIEGQGATLVEAAPGDSLQINNILPKNIRQIDFLVSIVKLFNLYVYEDKYDPSLIYLKPYIDFYSVDTSNAVDWTYKLNRDKPVKIKPMSEINAKKYNFKYKADNDYYNELYRKRYGQGYGDYTFDSQFEFAEQTKAFELVFSATPLVGYVGEDKIYPTIFKRTGPDSAPVEETVDCNIRILQSKKILGVTSWDIMNAGSILDSNTSYGYAGHLDDPDAPSNDLNFGVLYELFFVLVGGDLTNTQFNLYWSAYMAEITDKDSKLVTGYFYLTTADILNLDFSKYVQVDGVLYRLNKISDYNVSKPTDCAVQLLKVNYTIY